jgi:AcrR family transcriptional regulator
LTYNFALVTETAQQSAPRVRRSAELRREDVLQAAMTEFALGGSERTSTADIARRAGISQPYLYRLFPTKQALFIAAIERSFDTVRESFRDVAEDFTGEEAKAAMGNAYAELLASDRTFLRLQMQAYAACTDDPQVRAATLHSYARLWDEVVALSGMTTEETRDFFAHGMLLNVVAVLAINDESCGKDADALADRLLSVLGEQHPAAPPA